MVAASLSKKPGPQPRSSTFFPGANAPYLAGEYLKPGGHILIMRPYYADVSRGRLMNPGQTYSHAPIPGSVLFFDVELTARAIPSAASIIVRLAGAQAQDSSDQQLRELLMSVASI